MSDWNKEIDISLSERRIWLVKLPDYIISQWNNLPMEEANFGSVRIYEQTPGAPTKVTFHLAATSQTAHLPQDYDMYRGFLLLDAIAIEGKIEHECHLRPSTVNQAYKNIMKARNIQFNKPKRSIQVIDSIKEGVGASFMRPLPTSTLLMGRRKTPVELRRERLPKETLLDFLFSAFEKFKYWNFKDLLDYSHQPATYLKEVLTEICDLNKRGDYKGCYQLKAEYMNANRSNAASVIAPSLRQEAHQSTNGYHSYSPPEETIDEHEDDDDIEDEESIVMEDVTPY